MDTIVEKPKRVLSPEAKERMKIGLKKANEARKQKRELEKTAAGLNPEQLALVIAQAVNAANAGGGFNQDTFFTAIKDLVTGLRAPSELDVEREMQRKRHRKAIFEQEEEKHRQIKEREENCTHQRQDNTYRLVPLRGFPDGVLHGVCLGCGKLIEPSDGPLYYQQLRKIFFQQEGISL